MTTASTVLSPPSAPPMPSARLGIWVFLASEVSFFLALFSSYIVLRYGYREPWPDASQRLSVAVGAAGVGLLAAGSMLSWLGNTRSVAMSHKLAFLTALCGAAFLVLTGIEYSQLLGQGIRPRTDLFWSVFFILTAVHALHVAAGVLWWIWISLNPRASLQQYECATWYWHFIDVVWVVIFTGVYIV